MGFFRYFFRVRKRKARSKFCRRPVQICKDMSRISALSDELLIKILSFLPTKVAVSTSILSKQWKFLWMWLPKLEYSDYPKSGVHEFIDKNLPLHRAPVIESLRLNFSKSTTKPEDIKRCVEIAVSHNVRELKISYSSFSKEENIFPSSFYTCKSLLILKLSDMTLMNVPSMVCLPSLKTLKLFGVTLKNVPSMVCLPSLKTLDLMCLKFEGAESLQGLLDICPVLEDLSMHFSGKHNMGEFITVIVPTLQRLSLSMGIDWFSDGYVIDTPSLKYFKLEDLSYFGHYSVIKDMPELREAYVDVVFFVLKSVVGSITSVKHLTMCSEILKTGGEDDVYRGGFVFNQLEHLKLCVCKENSSDLLAQLLKDSPNLRVLDISFMICHGDDERNKMVCWNQPSSVPECLLSSLQIFIWSGYFGRPEDRDIAVYILKHACHLKKATIFADTLEYFIPNLKMIKELAFSFRASSTCELVFVDGDNVRGEGEEEQACFCPVS